MLLRTEVANLANLDSECVLKQQNINGGKIGEKSLINDSLSGEYLSLPFLSAAPSSPTCTLKGLF